MTMPLINRWALFIGAAGLLLLGCGKDGAPKEGTKAQFVAPPGASQQGAVAPPAPGTASPAPVKKAGYGASKIDTADKLPPVAVIEELKTVMNQAGATEFTKFFGGQLGEMPFVARDGTDLDRKDTRSWQRMYRHLIKKRVKRKKKRLGIDFWFMDDKLYGMRLILKDTADTLAMDMAAKLGATASDDTDSDGLRVLTWHDGNLTFKVRLRKKKTTLVIQDRDKGKEADNRIAGTEEIEGILKRARYYVGGKSANLPKVLRVLSELEELGDSTDGAPNPPEASLLRCRVAFNRGDFDGIARARCRSAMSNTINMGIKADAHYYLALMDMIDGRKRSAMKGLKEAEKIGKRHSRDTSKQARLRRKIASKRLSDAKKGKALKKALYYMFCFQSRGWSRGQTFYKEFGYRRKQSFFQDIRFYANLSQWEVNEIIQKAIKKCRR